MAGYEPITYENFKRQLAAANLSEEYIDEIWKLAMPCITLVRELFSDDVDEDTPVSRLGGTPSLPASLRWPGDPKGGQLHFLCQINLSELPDCPMRELLPTDGVLYFFVSERCLQGEMEYDGSWSVLYYPSSDVNAGELNMAPGPVFDMPVCRLKPVPDISLPPLTMFSYGDLAMNDDDPDDLDAAMDQFFLPRNTFACFFANQNLKMEDVIPVHQMFGYINSPQGMELAEGEHCLLQIDSDKYIELSWLDGGTIFFVISDKDLRARNWNGVQMRIDTC